LLEKPVSTANLARALRTALARRETAAPAAGAKELAHA
jgi:FixJ family two-component response regulator